MDETEDIYDNLLPALNLSDEIEKLQHENNVQQQLINSLESDIEKLCTRITEMKKIQDNLTRNISELYKTAKAEIDRKDRIIADLRNQLEEANQRKHYRIPFKRDRDSSPSLNQFTEDPGGKRRKHEENHFTYKDRHHGYENVMQDENHFKDRYSGYENLKRRRSKSSDKYKGDKEKGVDRENREKCFRSDKFRHDYERRHFLNRGERIVERSYKINPITAKNERDFRETDKREKKEEVKSQLKNSENEGKFETKPGTADTVVKNNLLRNTAKKNINQQKAQNEMVKSKNPMVAERSSVMNKHLDKNSENSSKTKIEEKNKEKHLTEKIVVNIKMKETKIETKMNKTKIEEVTKKLFERLEEETKQELITCPVSVSLCNISDLPLATPSTSVVSKETEKPKINDKETDSQSIQQKSSDTDKCNKDKNEDTEKPVEREKKMQVTKKPDEINSSECNPKKVENDKVPLQKNEENDKITSQKTDINNANELVTSVILSQKEEDSTNIRPAKINKKESKTVTSQKSKHVETTENPKLVSSNKNEDSVNRTSSKVDKKDNKELDTIKMIATDTHELTTKVASQKQVDKKEIKRSDTQKMIATDTDELTTKSSSQKEINKKEDTQKIVATDTRDLTAKVVSQKEVYKKENTKADTHELTAKVVLQKEVDKKENTKADTQKIVATVTSEPTTTVVSQKEVDKEKNKKADARKMTATDTHELTIKSFSQKEINKKESKKADSQKMVAIDTHKPTTKVVSKKENEVSVKENPIYEKENRKSVPRKIEKPTSELVKSNDKKKESAKEDQQKIHEKESVKSAVQKTEESQLKREEKEKPTEESLSQPSEKENQGLLMIKCDIKMQEFIEEEKHHSSILASILTHTTHIDKSMLDQDNATIKNDDNNAPREHMKNENVQNISKITENTTIPSKLEQENKEKNKSNNKEKDSTDRVKQNTTVDETMKSVRDDSSEQRNKNKKSEHKTNDNRAKRCRESTKKENKSKEKIIESTGGAREESDRVLRSATRRNSAREKLQKSFEEIEDEQKSTHSTSPNEQAFPPRVDLNGTPCVNLSHDGEIPVLHIEEFSNSGFNNNVVKPLLGEMNELKDSIVFGTENNSVVTSSPVCNRNVDKVKEDLDMSSDKSSSNISKSDLSVSLSSVNNSIEKVFNTSSARKRRRVILKMVD